MSSLAEARAVRYLLDAVYDKSLIDAAIKDNIPSQALFHMEQLCEKATKACLAIAGILITREHSYSYYVESILIPEKSELEENFQRLLPELSEIETVYISSRYGVDSYGRVTLEEYSQKDTVGLKNASLEYLELSFNYIELKCGKQLPRSKEELLAYFKSNYGEYISR